MSDNLKNSLSSIKEYWDKQSKKRRTYFLVFSFGIVALAMVAAIILNSVNGGYAVLYPGINQEESGELYSTLQTMSVSAQINSKGEVMVEKDRVDALLIELSEMGYPKTAPAYNVFSDNAGFTTTEFEKKQYLLFQLQDRIQITLKQITGVKNAVVTLSVPQESNYVWEDTNQDSRASVLLTMVPGYKMSPQKVSAIKTLVASSIPKMVPEGVTVVDAATSLEMKSQSDGADLTGFDSQRVDFETEIEKKIEDKVINILSLAYDPSCIRVSAAVVLDYDKMITEEINYLEGNDGNGVVSHRDESYSADGTILARGVVGESVNTDIPQYVNGGSGNSSDYSSYQSSTDYLVGHIKRQIEKNNVLLKEASVAVAINSPDLTEKERESLIETVSKAVNIVPENISLTSFALPEQGTIPVGGDGFIVEEGWKIPIAIGAGAALVMVMVLILMLTFRRKKNEKMPDEEPEPEDTITSVFEEIEDQKKRMKEAAHANRTKENALIDEIKEFTDDNPEITASLIRAWLKEED